MFDITEPRFKVGDQVVASKQYPNEIAVVTEVVPAEHIQRQRKPEEQSWSYIIQFVDHLGLWHEDSLKPFELDNSPFGVVLDELRSL